MTRSFHLLLVVSVTAGLSAASCKEEGCTDKDATNFNENARKDDGTCKYVDGCTDPDAVNFESTATRDDGTCFYEFVADNSTFAGFGSWPLQEIYHGIDTVNLGGEHGGDDSSSTRSVYFMDGQDPVDGLYPRGTLIVKYTTNTSGSLDVITAMAKRGGNFNPAYNDWEWFILNVDGSIAEDENGNPLRGANLMSGACGGCHAGAETDFVFSK